MVDVVSGGRGNALVERVRVNPAGSISNIKIEGVASLVQFAEAQAGVARHVQRHQTSTGHRRSRV